MVADSTYSFRAVRRAGVPLAAINNADMVVRGMARFRDWPAAVLPQFLCVELADYLYHRFIPDLVISPRLDPADTAAAGRFRAVAPIVRDECRPVAESGRRPERVMIMLSGSVFGSPVALPRRSAGRGGAPHIDVVGRPPPDGTAPPGVIYHGKLRDLLALMRQADLLVVNGGCSAVSEALVLRKPMVVLPVPRHAEQWVNSRIVRHLGVGIAAGEAGLEDAIDAALAGIDRPARRLSRPSPFGRRRDAGGRTDFRPGREGRPVKSLGRFGRYGSVALLSAGGDWATFALLVSALGVDQLASLMTARVVGGLFSFARQPPLDLGRPPADRDHPAGAPLPSALCIQLSAFGGPVPPVHRSFRLPPYPAKLATDTVCFVVNFMVMNQYVFHARRGMSGLRR